MTEAPIPVTTGIRRSAPYVLPVVIAVAVGAIFTEVSTIFTAVAVLGASIEFLRRRGPATQSGSVCKRWIVPFAPFGLLVLVAVGLNALRAELALEVFAIVFAVATGLAIVRWRVRGPRGVVAAVVVLGAITVPILALLGFDALWAASTLGQPDPWISLPLGMALIVGATWLFLRPWWVREPGKHPRAATLLVLFVLAAAQPFAAWCITRNDDKGSSLGKVRPVAVSELDVIVLRKGSDRTKLDRSASIRGWKVNTWVGQVTGERVRWGEGGEPPRAGRPDADRVLLLVVDGAPAQLDSARRLPQAPGERGEVVPWLRMADAVTQRDTPTFALLQSTNQDRLATWDSVLTGAGEAPDGKRHGEVLSLQRLGGDRTLADVALSHGVLSPTAEQDLALAERHRPALFFDRKEPYPTPLNIHELLASEKIRLCEKGQAFKSACPTVRSSADLHNEADHLAFDPDELAEVRDNSTIYVNVTRSGNEHPDTVYLDYWWYFPHNPTGAGRGALCGVGFVLAGVTCFDHQSDWEGVTIVLDGGTDPPSPTAVLYAQHDGTTRYEWPRLQRLWREGRDGGDLRRVRKRFGRRVDIDVRPMVFVARGTHASYPKSCASSVCRVAGEVLNEKRHDGKQEWTGNDDDRCRPICVTALPTRPGGNKRALWNAFDGPWGTTNCLVGKICTSSKPPLAPGAQGRYRTPWCARTTVVTVKGRDRHEKRPKDEDCPIRERPMTNSGGSQ
jgi:hypothetical protein